MGTPEAQRPESDYSQKRESARCQGYHGYGSFGNGRARGEHRFPERNEQEQATAFQHMSHIELDVLGPQPPAGNGMRQPPANLIDPGGQYPQPQAGFYIYGSARYP